MRVKINEKQKDLRVTPWPWEIFKKLRCSLQATIVSRTFYNIVPLSPTLHLCCSIFVDVNHPFLAL